MRMEKGERERESNEKREGWGERDGERKVNKKGD